MGLTGRRSSETPRLMWDELADEWVWVDVLVVEPDAPGPLMEHVREVARCRR